MRSSDSWSLVCLSKELRQDTLREVHLCKVVALSIWTGLKSQTLSSVLHNPPSLTMGKFVMERASSLEAVTSKLPIKTETRELAAQVFMNTPSSNSSCKNVSNWLSAKTRTHFQCRMRLTVFTRESAAISSPKTNYTKTSLEWRECLKSAKMIYALSSEPTKTS